MNNLVYSKYLFRLILIVTTFIVLLMMLDKPILPWRYSKTQPRSAPQYIWTQRTYPKDAFIPNPEKSLVKSSNQRITTKYPLTRYKMGNQLFVFASVYGIARRNNITPAMRGTPTSSLRLFDIFRVPTQSDPLPLPHAGQIFEETAYGMYDSRMETLYQNHNESNIYLTKFLQSWKYFKHVESEIRDQFTLLPETRQRAEDHIKEIIPEKFQDRKYTKVGVHVRLGDMTDMRFMDMGYNTAPVEYFINAMDFYKKKFTNVIFIICSNDMEWVTSCIKGENVFYSYKSDGELDFITLAVMDHVIQSVGTFGWWTAWIANGTSVYYKYPLLAKSMLTTRFNSEDFFLPDWIPMT